MKKVIVALITSVIFSVPSFAGVEEAGVCLARVPARAVGTMRSFCRATSNQCQEAYKDRDPSQLAMVPVFTGIFISDVIILGIATMLAPFKASYALLSQKPAPPLRKVEDLQGYYESRFGIYSSETLIRN